MAVALTAEQEREQANTGTKAVAESHRFDEAALERWMQANVAGTPARWRCASSRVASPTRPISW